MKLEDWNRASEVQARAALEVCCASPGWVDEMMRRRPFADEGSLLSAADSAWWRLPADQWLNAFAAHPRIGEKKLSEWCAQEQGGVLAAASQIRTELAEANRKYEERFGWIFLVNASGKSGAEILARMKERLPHSPEEELRVAAGEQAQITTLRLKRLLNT